MPRGNEIKEESKLVRCLLIGPSKAGKTHWSLAAANEGYNVIIFDGDNSRRTISHIEKNDSIFHFDVNDNMFQPRFAPVIREFCTSRRFVWDDNAQTIFDVVKGE